ncbi:peptidase M23 [Methylomonas lenta]|uniref:Peptidase M23 n=1 Tax=Methylomonas lenta TaxID=980561 RepID=A0A177N4J8_9GAMM|nr:peptidase M23 [Methylomonas lenta]
MLRWQNLFLLLLVSTTATAKTLYKYKDDQGRWYFTDKPPVTQHKVETRLLKPAPKQRVRLEKTGSPSNLAFYLINQYPGPIEVAIDWEQPTNLVSIPELPKRFVIEPGKSDTLFSISAIGQTTSSQTFTLQYQYVVGRPLPHYSRQTAYWPPLAPGSHFRVTQAFNGEFSHTDPQNRYAVDIMMPIGTPIYAARDGVVLEVENDFFSSGTQQAYANKANSIRILHDDGSMAIYAHLALEKALVTPGLRVQAGELIGYSGNTGFSSGPHLHFAVQINQGMALTSVPFEFLDANQHAFEPQPGSWLEGINPKP